MKYSIIIVAYGAQDKLYKCLDSLAEHVPDSSAEIIIVDNHPEEPLNLKSEYIYKLNKNQIEGYCSVEVVTPGENLGYAAGANLGAKYATGRYLVFVNPDTIVSECWAEEMSKALEGENVGAVGPISNYVAGLQKDTYHMYPYEDYKQSAKMALKGMSGRFMETKMLIGFFLMTKKEVFEEVGRFDPDLFLGCDDLDYSLKLQDHGYKMLVVSSIYVYHFGHESFKIKPDSELIGKQTEAKYAGKLMEKYNGNPPTAQELWGFQMINTRTDDKKQKLSVSMIVREVNQKLIDLVDRLYFADEIIIVETSPLLGKVIVGHKVKTYVFKWNDSFADARNYSLSKCTGDWVLWLDDDDEIPEETGELIRAIIDKPGPITKEKKCHFSLRLKDVGADQIFYADQPRLFPNVGLEWRGRVHENYLDSAAEKGLQPVVVKNVEIIHTGYADPKLSREKSLRNIKLLEMEPETAETLFHLGKQYHAIDEHEKAIGWYEKAFTATPEENKEGRDHLRYSIALCRYQYGSFIHPKTMDLLLDNSKKDATFLKAEWFLLGGKNFEASKLYEEYLRFGEITDVRGTHQDSFRRQSKLRLKLIEKGGNRVPTI